MTMVEVILSAKSDGVAPLHRVLARHERDGLSGQFVISHCLRIIRSVRVVVDKRRATKCVTPLLRLASMPMFGNVYDHIFTCFGNTFLLNEETHLTPPIHVYSNYNICTCCSQGRHTRKHANSPNLSGFLYLFISPTDRRRGCLFHLQSAHRYSLSRRRSTRLKKSPRSQPMKAVFGVRTRDSGLPCFWRRGTPAPPVVSTHPGVVPHSPFQPCGCLLLPGGTADFPTEGASRR